MAYSYRPYSLCTLGFKLQSLANSISAWRVRRKSPDPCSLPARLTAARPAPSPQLPPTGPPGPPRACQRQQHRGESSATEGSARGVVAGGLNLSQRLPSSWWVHSSPPVRAQHRCVAAALPRRCANFAPPSRRCHSLALLPSPPPRPLRIDAFSHCLSLKRSHRDAANRLHGSAHPGPGSSSRAWQYIVVVAPTARPASPGRRSGSSRPPPERS